MRLNPFRSKLAVAGHTQETICIIATTVDPRRHFAGLAAAATTTDCTRPTALPVHGVLLPFSNQGQSNCKANHVEYTFVISQPLHSLHVGLADQAGETYQADLVSTAPAHIGCKIRSLHYGLHAFRLCAQISLCRAGSCLYIRAGLGDDARWE